MKNVIFAAILPFALTACAVIPPGPLASAEPGPALVWAALGQRVYVDGPQVTPLEVLEDSRCPTRVQCAWAGRVRLRATIHLGTGDTTRELVTGTPVPVADGSLELMEVRPAKTSGEFVTSGDYRFGLRFMGGL